MQKARRAKKQRQPNEMNKENHFTTVYDEISAQKLCAGMMSKGARHAGREGFYTAVPSLQGTHRLYGAANASQ